MGVQFWTPAHVGVACVSPFYSHSVPPPFFPFSGNLYDASGLLLGLALCAWSCVIRTLLNQSLPVRQWQCLFKYLIYTRGGKPVALRCCWTQSRISPSQHGQWWSGMMGIVVINIWKATGSPPMVFFIIPFNSILMEDKALVSAAIMVPPMLEGSTCIFIFFKQVKKKSPETERENLHGCVLLWRVGRGGGKQQRVRRVWCAKMPAHNMRSTFGGSLLHTAATVTDCASCFIWNRRAGERP